MQDGLLLPMGFPPQNIASGQDYVPQDGDLFISTYPKCGTTWVSYIMYLLVRRRPVAADESFRLLFPHLEEVGRDVVEKTEQPRLIKTHLPLAMTPFSDAARYVVVIRNPFDCAVSFYHHTVGFPHHYDFADGDAETFIDCFIDGEVDFGDYFDHLLSWIEASAQPHVHLVTYESMRADTRAGICDIARFIGGEAAGVADDPDMLEWVQTESSLASMRRNQQRWASDRPGAEPFVRKGAVNDWQSLFTAAQARRLAAKFRERTAGTPAAGLWPDTIAEAAAR